MHLAMPLTAYPDTVSLAHLTLASSPCTDYPTLHPQDLTPTLTLTTLPCTLKAIPDNAGSRILDLIKNQGGKQPRFLRFLTALCSVNGVAIQDKQAQP